MSKLQLPDVTLVAIDHEPALALRALRKSMEHADFHHVLLLTDLNSVIPYDADIDGIEIRGMDLRQLSWPNWYCEFILRHLYRFIRTEFCLKVEWDGYVINPKAWQHDFLSFDYIGAPWAWHKSKTVGNGGFSLRSRRLLNLTAELIYKRPIALDDEFIARTIRDWLEEYYAVRFPTSDIAASFALERNPPKFLQNAPEEFHPFGFHGFFNFWRYHTDAEIIALAGQMPDYLVLKPEYVELMDHYREAQNNSTYHALDERLHLARGR